MTATEVWTIGRLLEWTTDFLRKNHSDSPRLEAEVLLAHARNCSRIQLYTSFAEEPNETERAAFREMVKRRAEGTPVAYLVGHKEFYSIDFIVGPDCLIPRPETEHLVVAALDWLKQRSASNPTATPPTIVDVCTGSGCVAISIAKNLPSATKTFVKQSGAGSTESEPEALAASPSQNGSVRILATDISPAALQVARSNLQRHELIERIELFEGDLLDAVPSTVIGIDLIVANPPYVSESEFAGLAKDVRQFEPKLALVSDDDGLAASLRLIEQAESRLAPGGAIMLESSPMVIPRLEAAFSSRPAWQLKPTIKDLSGHPRIVTAHRT